MNTVILVLVKDEDRDPGDRRALFLALDPGSRERAIQDDGEINPTG